MSFGGATVPDGYVVRSFCVKVMATKAKQKRAFGLIEAGGDVQPEFASFFDQAHRADQGRVVGMVVG